MTEIQATVNNRHYRLQVSNHAESSQVCTAVSTLVQTLEGSLCNHDSAVCHYSILQPGNAVIEFLAEDEYPAEDFRCVLIGLMQLQKTYPEEIVLIQNFFS